jgi:hypothetical protein
MCARCKQKGLHRFGRAGCPFQDLDDRKARLADAFAVEKVAGGMSKTEAWEVANAEFT